MEVVARDRPSAAHQLHLTGADWTTIAAQTGYVSGRVAAQAVGIWLQKIAVEQDRENLANALIEMGSPTQWRQFFAGAFKKILEGGPGRSERLEVSYWQSLDLSARRRAS